MNRITERDAKVLEINALLSHNSFNYLHTLLAKLIYDEHTYIKNKFSRKLTPEDLPALNESIRVRSYLIWLNEDLEKLLRSLADAKENVSAILPEHNSKKSIKEKIWQTIRTLIHLGTRPPR